MEVIPDEAIRVTKFVVDLNITTEGKSRDALEYCRRSWLSELEETKYGNIDIFGGVGDRWVCEAETRPGLEHATNLWRNCEQAREADGFLFPLCCNLRCTYYWKGHCTSYNNRIYNFSGAGDMDPSLDKIYIENLKTQCISVLDSTTTMEMDIISALTFDSHYFGNLALNIGLFQSYAALLTYSIPLLAHTGLTSEIKPSFSKT